MGWALSEPLVAVLLALEGNELIVSLLKLLLNREDHRLDLGILSGLGLKELQGHNHGVGCG